MAWLVIAPSAIASDPAKAVRVCDPVQLKRLLANAADPNESGPRTGQPALQAAVVAAKPVRVELPLKAGADKSRRDRDGQTALQLAAAIEDKKTRDFVTYLPLTMGREDGAALKPWMLDSAAQRGQTGVAEMLLRLGADPKKSNPKATPR